MFKAKNIRLNDSTIDLHGQTKEYALKFLEEKLNSTTKETLSVIVGKGNNSRNGPVLGPAVEEWLRSNNYTFGYDPRNSGCIKVMQQSTPNNKQ
jgi:DNA-nicking Smr family endonuclease